MAQEAGIPKSVYAADPASRSPGAAASGLPAFYLSIWPPSSRTRDAVTKHLVENLSTPSVISSRYGTFSPEAASSAASRIELDAFDAASASAGGGDDPSAASVDDPSAASVDDGIKILHVYSSEISRRVMEFVKAKGSPPDGGGASPGTIDSLASASASGEEGKVSLQG